MLPLVADWEGTGRPSIGVFEPNTGSWHLDNGNGETLVHLPEILASRAMDLPAAFRS
jgi:hypothetical protein